MDIYTLNQLRYFYKLAQCLNYRLAAEQLLISEPALSKQIRLFEDSVGTKLFKKIGRNIQLTDEGKQIAQGVGDVLREIDSLNTQINQLKNPYEQKIKIGISGNQIIYPYVKMLKNDFENIQVYISEMETSSVIDLLKKHRLDVGMIYDSFSDDDLITHTTFEDEIVAVTNENNLDFSDKEVIKSTNLSDVKLAVLTENYFIRKNLDNYFSNHLLIPNYQFELNNYQSCINVLSDNDVVTFVTKSYLKSINIDGLRMMKISDMHIPLKISLVTLKEKSVSGPIRRLIDLIHQKD